MLGSGSPIHLPRIMQTGCDTDRFLGLGRCVGNEPRLGAVGAHLGVETVDVAAFGAPLVVDIHWVSSVVMEAAALGWSRQTSLLAERSPEGLLPAGPPPFSG